MTAPIEDVTSLPGKKVTDQDGRPLGEIKEIYAVEGDGHPVWITLDASTGLGEKRTTFIPIARLKEEDGALRVPYSKNHIENTPEVDAGDGISPECDRQLRDHFGIDRADQELRADNHSYATLVPEEEGTAKKADDVDSLDTPDPDKRTDETRERLEDPGSSEIRHVSAQDVTSEDGSSSEEQSES
jgi:PRC-barrel domain